MIDLGRYNHMGLIYVHTHPIMVVLNFKLISAEGIQIGKIVEYDESPY